MKKPISPPVAIGLIVVLVLVIVGVLVLSSKGPGEGKRPDASAGGIRTLGGKVLPTASGGGN
jgi:hypothetical protein